MTVKITYKSRYNTLVNHCKNKGKKLRLTYDEYEKIIKDKNCQYCNGKLSRTSYSLDRVNNDLGYSLDNVVPCCQKCNSKKGNRLK